MLYEAFASKGTEEGSLTILGCDGMTGCRIKHRRVMAGNRHMMSD